MKKRIDKSQRLRVTKPAEGDTAHAIKLWALGRRQSCVPHLIKTFWVLTGRLGCF
jgi:hypothetical protein